MKEFGVTYNPIALNSMHEHNRNLSIEDKKLKEIKKEKTYIKNKSRHCRIYSISHKATSLFIEIDKYFNYKYKFEFCIYDRDNRKYVKRERGVYIGDLRLSKNKYRFFDFYFKNSNEIRIAIEFDEYGHNSPKQIEADLLREKEIFIKKPDLYLFRIPESYYDNNFIIMFDDITKLIENPEYKTRLNYDCLTKQIQNKKPYKIL
jgi:hypothetical protein